MRTPPRVLRSFGAIVLPAVVALAAGCAPFIDVSHPTTGLLEPSTVCAPSHVQEPLILTATRPAAAHLEPAGAWGDDRLQHARETRAEIPYGKGRMATVGADNRIDLWDVATGALLAHVDLEDASLFAVASAAGDLFVRDGKGNLVGIDGASSAVRFRTLVPESTGGLAMSADERHVQVDGRLDYRVDVATGQIAANNLYPAHPSRGRAPDDEAARRGIGALAFDGTTRRVALLVPEDGIRRAPDTDRDTDPDAPPERPRFGPVTLEIRDVATGKLLGSTRYIFAPAIARPFRFAFDPSGAVVAVEEIENGRVTKRTRWSVPSGELLGAEKAYDPVVNNPAFLARKPLRSAPLWRLAVSADGRTGAFRDGAGVVWLTGPGDGSACALHTAVEPWPRAFALDDDGAAITLVRGERDLTIERWDARRRTRTGTFAIDHLFAVTLLRGGRAILERDAWGLDRSPPPERDHFFVDLASSEPPRWLRTPPTKPGSRWELEDAVFTADAKTVFATTNYGSMLSAWDVDGGDKLFDIAYIREHEPLALSPDGRFLVYTSGEGTGLRLYEVAARRILPVRFGLGSLRAAVFSSDGRTLATAGDDGLVTLLSIPGGEVIAKADLRGRADWPTSLGFGGEHLWIGTARGAVIRVKLAGNWASP